MRFGVRLHATTFLLISLLLSFPDQLRAQAAAGTIILTDPGTDIEPSNKHWPPVRFHDDNWSAAHLVGTRVLTEAGRNVGKVEDVLVSREGWIVDVLISLSSFVPLDDQKIAVRWRDLQFGPNMRWVKVPLQEVQTDSYSLFSWTSHGGDIAATPASWRVTELIGSHATMADDALHVLIADVVFSREGRAKGVIVRRLGSPWGPGWDLPSRRAYGHEFAGDTAPFAFVQMSNVNGFR
jgi:sporulation protein YlmC with PRC-barrel domain